MVNYIGKTKDSKEEHSEVIAEELLNLNIRNRISSIAEVIREKGYCIKSHDGRVTTGRSKDQSNRTEEWFALELFNQSKNGKIFNKLGKVIDYQIPLKNKRTDLVGKIDLISTTEDDVFLIELKTEKNNETLLRCVLEIATYYQILSKPKFIDSYKNEFKHLSEKNIKKAILISEGSSQHNELKCINKGEKNNLKRIMDELEVQGYVIDEKTFKVQ